MEVGQFDRVANLFDLGPESTHLLVGDIGDLLEYQFFDLRTGQALENAVAAGTADSSILKTLAAHFADGLARCSAALAPAGLEALSATGRHVLGQLQDP